MATIQGIYIALFGRPADPLGLDYFNGVTNNGQDLAQIGNLAGQPEYLERFEGQSYAQIVTSIYQDLFGRNPEAGGLAFFVAQLESGAQTINTIAINILDGAEGPDAAIVAAKIAAADQFTAAVRADPDALAAYSGDSGKAFGQAFLEQIDSADDTLTDEQVAQQVGDFGDTDQNIGDTFTLTSGIDNITGTADNDTVVAAVSAVAGETTLQSGDVINGGAGEDTLRIVSSNGGTTIIPSLTSVENVVFQGFAGAATILNLANSTGVEGVSLENGGSSLTVTNADRILELGASNTTGGTLTATYRAATVAGTADVQNVVLNDTAATTINVAGVETVNITATGTNTGAILTAAAATNVTVDGAGSLVLGGAALASTVTTFNASANTGGVTAVFAVGGNVAVTGGAGNDTFSFGEGLTATAGAVAGDVVNGGAGFDTVRVDLAGGAASNISLAPAAAAFNALTSIERVAFDGQSGVTVNGATFTNAGITNIEFNTSGGGIGVPGDDTIDNAGSARTYEFGAANGGNATFNMNGTSTALNIDLLGTAGAAPVAGAANTVEVGTIDVNLAGTQPAGTLSTINLSSLGNFTPGNIVAGNTLGFTAGSFNSVASIDAVSGSTVVVDGNAALDIGGSVANVIVNASAHTGGLVFQGSAFTAVGGAGAGGAATTLTAGIDTISLGAGRDVVQFAANGLDSGVIQFTGAAGAATANGNILVDVVSGFDAGANGDVLDIAGTAATYGALTAATQTQINALSGANLSLAGAANVAAIAHDVAGWTAFSFQGNTYALYENSADTTNFANADTLVQLTGIAVADLTADNFG